MLEKLSESDPTLEVLFVGAGKALERQLVEDAGWRYTQVSAGKYRRYKRGLLAAAADVRTNAQNARDLFRTIAGLRQASKLIRQFKPEVVFIKGSYVGIPVGIAARRNRIPIILHDSDTVLGLTNRYLAKYATVLAVGWPAEQYARYHLAHIKYVGNPLRREAITGTKAAAEQFFSLYKQKPNILVFGGSLGARVINQSVIENLQVLTKQYNVIHVTGEQGIEQARFARHELSQELQTYYKPYEFLHAEMGLAYAAADLVVSRSGANTVAELSSWSKPAILIPYQGSANREQQANAAALSKAGAARVIDQDELGGRRLLAEIDKLMDNPSDRRYLAANIAKFHKPDAAEHLARLILDLAHGRGEGRDGTPAA